MNKGIVYIVGGEKYAKWALKSILSLRENGGRAGQQPVHINFLGELFFEDQFNDLGCSVIPHNDAPSHHAHRKLKSVVMQEVPFDRYVMIDADTFIQGDFYEMFDLIPDDGVAGIEDGNFQSHLQMAKFLFVTKHAKGDIRSLVKEMLGVDYGTEESFPPYFNVGVIGLTKSASKTIGKELYTLLVKLSENKAYNPHDEQLPMNAIMHLNGISAIAVDPIYNYTRSRMKNNKKKGIHDNIKDNVRIVHNRHYSKEADWINMTPVEIRMKEILN